VKFQPGNPKPANSGRKKGTPNNKRLKTVSQALADSGLEPVIEIVKLLQHGDMKDKDRADLWVDLLSYCQAKPKEIEDPGDDVGDENPLDGLTTADLLKLVRPNEAP
jgi:hypothetical protein